MIPGEFSYSLVFQSNVEIVKLEARQKKGWEISLLTLGIIFQNHDNLI